MAYLSTAIKSIEEPELDMEELLWGDVREEVYQVNPELAKICDIINPNGDYPLLKVRYPYGAKIVEKGQFKLPTSANGLTSSNDSLVPERIKKLLGYSPIPLALILHNDSEVFVEFDNRVIPLNFFNSGDLFGVFEVLDPEGLNASLPIWSVTAGARSVFMIPRITEAIGHRRIRKEFGITQEAPSDFSRQWQIFKGIYNAAGGVERWNNTILTFTSKWFEEKDEGSWSKFHEYLFKVGWKQLQLFRDVVEISLLWASFSDAINSKNLKPRPYLIDTIKHLVSIANGEGIAFKPAIDETALPVALIQQADIDIYNLKTYIPTIMQPCKLQSEEEIAYYSLAFPTILESSPYVKNAPSIMEDERDIKRLLETLIKTINKKNNVINPLKHTVYEFFHTDMDQYEEIQNSKSIPLEDPRFNICLTKDSKDKIFCSSSPFFRGCIRISTPSHKEQ